MCGRYGLSHTRSEIEDFFQVEIPEEYAPRYNIAPTQPVLIVRENRHKPKGREAAHVVWGLIPPWAEDIKIGQKMINARCETAADKPSFRNALKRRRCVVPISGFYEWKGAPGHKQPYYITAADGQPLALGGLWEVWSGPNGEEIESCTILTTSANQTLRSLHDRMPVIIPQNSIPTWLDTLNEDVRTLGPLLQPRPDSEIKLAPVSPLVNSYKNEGRQLIEPMAQAGPPPAPEKAEKSPPDYDWF